MRASARYGVSLLERTRRMGLRSMSSSDDAAINVGTVSSVARRAGEGERRNVAGRPGRGGGGGGGREGRRERGGGGWRGRGGEDGEGREGKGERSGGRERGKTRQGSADGSAGPARCPSRPGAPGAASPARQRARLRRPSEAPASATCPRLPRPGPGAPRAGLRPAPGSLSRSGDGDEVNRGHAFRRANDGSLWPAPVCTSRFGTC